MKLKLTMTGARLLLTLFVTLSVSLSVTRCGCVLYTQLVTYLKGLSDAAYNTHCLTLWVKSNNRPNSNSGVSIQQSVGSNSTP